MQQCAGIPDRIDQSREWQRSVVREGTSSTGHAAFGLASIHNGHGSTGRSECHAVLEEEHEFFDAVRLFISNTCAPNLHTPKRTYCRWI